MGNQLGIFGKSTATIDVSESTTVSSIVDCVKKGPPAVLHMPAAFTGTALTFQCATETDGTYQVLYSGGADVSVTVAAAKNVVLDPTIFYGVKYMKIVSGSAEGADRAIVVSHRET